MEQEKIKGLLADYYEGLTSRKDELILMDYFRHSEVPVEMEADRELFLSLYDASKDEIPDHQFDEKLFATIEEIEKKKAPAGIRRLIYTVSGVAAGLLLLAGSYFFLYERQVQEITFANNDYSIDETMLAYEEARNALLLVSQVMNTGTEQLGMLSKMTDAAHELTVINKFYEGAGELQMLSKFEETTDKIFNNQ